MERITLKATHVKRGLMLLAALLAALNVTVIDVQRSRPVAGQTVLVENGRITAVGPTGELTLPATARVIDGLDRFVMPALWDMHTHVYAFSPLLDLPLYIAYGVTNVRDMQGCPMPDDPFIACPEDKRRWTRDCPPSLEPRRRKRHARTSATAPARRTPSRSTIASRGTPISPSPMRRGGWE